MNAQDARKLTQESGANQGYDNIIKSIEQVAKQGKNELWLYNPPHPLVKKRLTDNGFIISQDGTDPRGEYSLLITW